jgi:hypothetical protein
MFALKLRRQTQNVVNEAKEHRGWFRWLLTTPLVAIVVCIGLGSYWSIEPDVFDIRELAIQQIGNDSKIAISGIVTTSTLIKVTTVLLQKNGGFISNDINPVSSLLDNISSWEYGVIVQVRDLARVLRNGFSRQQSQSKEDRDLAIADPQLNFDTESWIFPTTEEQYQKGVNALLNYQARLENPTLGEARFFVRIDTLRNWLELVSMRLGDLAYRLSASVGMDEIDTYAIWDLKRDQTTVVRGDPAAKTPWLEIDNVFYEARGGAWVLLHFMQAIQIDFAQVLIDKKAMESMEQIIKKLDQTHKAVWSPLILNGTGFGVVANHSLALASYISQANAAVIDLTDLLRQG